MQAQTAQPRWSIAARAMQLATALLLAMGLSACGDDDGGDDDDGDTITLAFPTAAGTSVMVVDTGVDEALLVAAELADGAAQQVRAVPLPGTTLWAAPRHDADAALVLSAGLRGVGQGAVLSQLSRDGTLTSYALGGAFNAVKQSEDGRFALAYLAQGGDEVVFSPSEVAVVDLDTEGPSAERLALSLPGGAPLSLWLSPQMRVGSANYHFAVVLSDNHATLLDLEEADGPQITVQLGAATGEGRVTPQQVVFDAAGGRVLLRGSDSDDLYVLTLEAAGAQRQGRVWPTVEVWPAGAQPSDIATFVVGEQTQVLAVSERDAALRVVTLPSGNDVAVPMDVDANRVAAFTDGDAGPRAVLYRTDSPWIALAELEGLLEDPADRTRVLKLQQPVRGLEVLAGQALAVVDHGPALLGILDLVAGGEQLLAVHGGGDGSPPMVIADGALQSLWVGSPGEHLVGFASLSDGRTGEVLLERPIAAMAAVPDAARIAVVHDDGSVTLLDADSPGRQGATRIVVR